MTYNASLNRSTEGRLIRDLSTPNNTQARRVAEIIQRLAPDILLINEFDYDENGEALELFQTNYLGVSQNGQEAQVYPHRFSAESNTGLPTEFDFDFGFGNFPGQFGMAVLSKFPIQEDDIRTFQRFLWKDMPDNFIPTEFYSPAEQEIFRLSSKSHWDIPIEVEGSIIHILASHPTPPVFDGPEDRNGRRNHDEIRLWADYLSNRAYLYDDQGQFGGLPSGSRFVIMGDQNADPVDGDSVNGAINQLLEHPAVNDTSPMSAENGSDTATFSGGLRVDYALPSRAGFEVTDSEVYWPEAEPERTLIRASDHRPVWIDVTLTPTRREAFQNIILAQNPLTLSWQSISGLDYSIEGCAELGCENWLPISVPITSSNGISTASLPNSSEVKMFYRIRASFP